MPYKTVWLEPEVFVEHKGVKVYHVYRNDDVDQGVRMFWYGLSPHCLDEWNNIEEKVFDVRDVANALGMHLPNSEDEIKDVLKAAIDRALRGSPADCGRDFADCWEHRLSEEADPIGPVVELLGPELRSAVVTVLEFCSATKSLSLDEAILCQLDLNDEAFEEAVKLLEKLI
jgi:hypothetical protein